MKKLLTLFLLLISLSSLLLISASALGGSRVYDPEGILSAEERASVEAQLSVASESVGLEVLLYLNDYSKNYTPSEGALLSAFGLTDTSDAVILLIDASEQVSYYELFTYGDGYKLISDSAADRILDNDALYTAIKLEADFAEGARRFAALVSEEIPAARRSANLRVILIPIIIALIAGGIAVTVVVVRYKRKLKSPVYPLSKYSSLELHHSSDTYLRTDVVRTRINTSSGSGGSGGSRGGSRGRR